MCQRIGRVAVGGVGLHQPQRVLLIQKHLPARGGTRHSQQHRMAPHRPQDAAPSSRWVRYLMRASRSIISPLPALPITLLLLPLPTKLLLLPLPTKLLLPPFPRLKLALSFACNEFSQWPVDKSQRVQGAGAHLLQIQILLDQVGEGRRRGRPAQRGEEDEMGGGRELRKETKGTR
jgi:hypothetical protein